MVDSDSFRRLIYIPPTKTTGIKRSRRLNHLADVPFRGRILVANPHLSPDPFGWGDPSPDQLGPGDSSRDLLIPDRWRSLNYPKKVTKNQLGGVLGFFFRCLSGWVASEGSTRHLNPSDFRCCNGWWLDLLSSVSDSPPGLALKAGGRGRLTPSENGSFLDLDSLFPTRATKLHSQNRVKSGQLWRCQLNRQKVNFKVMFHNSLYRCFQGVL